LIFLQISSWLSEGRGSDKNAVAGQGIGGIVPSWREARGWEGAEKAEEEEGGGRRKEEEGGRKQVGLSS
jgi:hypothetical protein